MRKTLWGFHPKEVTEAMDALAQQNTSLMQRNDRLENELKDLRIQLEDAQASIATQMTQADRDDYKDLKIAYAALQGNMKEHKDELERLEAEAAASHEMAQTEHSEAEKQRAENAVLRLDLQSAKDELEAVRNQLSGMTEELSSARAALDAANSQLEQSNTALEKANEELADFRSGMNSSEQTFEGDFLDVSEFRTMLLKACTDVADTKQSTREKMNATIQEFSEKWTMAHDELLRLMADMDEVRTQAKENFLSSANDILQYFQGMDDESSQIHTQLEQLAVRREQLQTEMEDAVEHLRSSPTQPVSTGEVREPSQNALVEKTHSAVVDLQQMRRFINNK